MYFLIPSSRTLAAMSPWHQELCVCVGGRNHRRVQGAPRILSQTSFQMEKMLDGEATAPPARVTPSPPRGPRRRKSFTPEK